MMLKVENLSFTVESTEILKGITFNLEAGDWLGVIGPNGAGKSTLLKCILQINNTYSGIISHEDSSLASMEHRERGKLLSYVPQMNLDIDSHFSVWDIMHMTRYPYSSLMGGLSENEIKQGESLLKEFDLIELRNHSISHLSGGERQRVMLAASLFQDSDILIMDEPTSYLDPLHQEELIGYLSKLKNKIVILVTHDLNLAKLMCNKILALKKSESAFFGEAKDFDTKKLNDLFGKEFKTITDDGNEIIIPINYQL